jgi:hypothetical protein
MDTGRETDPPGYVRTLSETGLPGTEDLNWLDFGIEHRSRYERRDDDMRRPVLTTDNQFLMRSRTYVGLREIVDPFRFGFEFQDSRQFNSQFPDSDRDINEADILQAFGELYFRDAFGPGEHLRFRAGRMSFDLVDRTLFSRNRWRNTTTAYDGFRLQLGEDTSDWQFNFVAAQPVDRRLIQPDRTDDHRWIYGVVGAWRRWPEYIILEPYYFLLDSERKRPSREDREIHTLGLRGYGLINATRFDYDFNAAFQFGDDGPRSHRAFGASGELGYAFDHDWHPRLSVSGLYAGGDRNPTDGVNERFDRLFGRSHGLSTSDLIIWENVIGAKVRYDMDINDKVEFDAAYGGYWLASDSDVFGTTGRRDPAGRSGDFAGQEIELRLEYTVSRRMRIEVGYSYFIPGTFLRKTGPSDDSDFFYVQITLRL